MKLTAVICLIDVTLKTKFVSLDYAMTEKLLKSFTGQNPCVAVGQFKHELLIGDVVSTNLEYNVENRMARLTLTGPIGDSTRITGVVMDGEKGRTYTTYLHLFSSAPFRKYSEVKDILQPWDTINAFYLPNRTHNTYTVNSVTEYGGGTRSVQIGKSSVVNDDNHLVTITHKRNEIGFPKGYDYPNTYLGLPKPVNTPAIRMGKVSYKNYVCQCCGNMQEIQTNHEGSCWAYCSNCSWTVSKFGDDFYSHRQRPFLTFQHTGLILREGLERGTAIYESLTCPRLAEETDI